MSIETPYKIYKYTAPGRKSFVNEQCVWTPGEWKTHPDYECKDTTDRIMNCFGAYPHPYLAVGQAEHIMGRSKAPLKRADITLWEGEASGAMYGLLDNPERIFSKFLTQNMRIIKQIDEPVLKDTISTKVIIYALRKFLSPVEHPKIYDEFDQFIATMTEHNAKEMKHFLKETFDIIKIKKLHKSHIFFNVLGVPMRHQEDLKEDIEELLITISYGIPLKPDGWYEVCESAINS